MQYVEAPAAPPVIWKPIVFMAGGITGCPDWQAELAGKLAEVQEGSLFNPRRASQDKLDEEESIKQIHWEFTWLWQASIVTFWFPKETICPITLLELGEHVVRSRLAQANVPSLCIGIEPGYQRALDVKVQASLVNPTITIVDSLDKLAQFIAEQIRIKAEEDGK